MAQFDIGDFLSDRLLEPVMHFLGVGHLPQLGIVDRPQTYANH